MKRQIVLLYVLVLFCLTFSIGALLIVVQDHGVFTPNKPADTPTPYPYTTAPHITNAPTLQPTIHPDPTTVTLSSGDLTFTYTKSDMENLADGISRVTYIITAKSQTNTPITINYNDFYLTLSVMRNIINMDMGTVTPKNSGTLTLNPSHTTQTFTLTFEFPTNLFNGMDQARTYYQLYYNGTTTLQQP